MASATVNVWLLVDADGNTAVGATADEARARYEEDVMALVDCDGFRLVQVDVVVPLPELSAITLVATAGEIAGPAGK